MREGKGRGREGNASGAEFLDPAPHMTSNEHFWHMDRVIIPETDEHTALVAVTRLQHGY